MAAVVLLCAGACEATVLITSYLLVDSMVARDAQMEAGARVNTAYNLGVAAGSAVGGMVLDRSRAGVVFALATANGRDRSVRGDGARTRNLPHPTTAAGCRTR
ncbi:hypothetical protein [Streptomyces sp. NPDC056682]|uniref:hypothetical protein n=1 Tax=Streptomyces sp. NPDC056682 TaxID=3345909 RepID=UPI00368A80C8